MLTSKTESTDWLRKTRYCNYHPPTTAICFTQQQSLECLQTFLRSSHLTGLPRHPSVLSAARAEQPSNRVPVVVTAMRGHSFKRQLKSNALLDSHPLYFQAAQLRIQALAEQHPSSYDDTLSFGNSVRRNRILRQSDCLMGTAIGSVRVFSISTTDSRQETHVSSHSPFPLDDSLTSKLSLL